MGVSRQAAGQRMFQGFSTAAIVLRPVMTAAGVVLAVMLYRKGNKNA